MLEKLGMAQAGRWPAALDKAQVPGSGDGEVGYELGRAAWLAR